MDAATTARLLVINAGSSSLKFKVRPTGKGGEQTGREMMTKCELCSVK